MFIIIGQSLSVAKYIIDAAQISHKETLVMISPHDI